MALLYLEESNPRLRHRDNLLSESSRPLSPSSPADSPAEKQKPQITLLLVLCMIFEFCVRWTVNAYDSSYGNYLMHTYGVDQRPLLHPEHGHLSGTALLLPHDGGEAASPHPLPRRHRTAPGGDLLLADGHRPQQDVLHGLLHAPVGQLQHVHARTHLHRLARIGALA